MAEALELNVEASTGLACTFVSSCQSLQAGRQELVARASGYCDDMKNASKFYDTLMFGNGIKRNAMEGLCDDTRLFSRGLESHGGFLLPF